MSCIPEYMNLKKVPVKGRQDGKLLNKVYGRSEMDP